MSTPDMDVIKEIPGYKVILKAVLKSQIQQLVETLAAHTDEESVILTASVTDGTLSHLGSASGKTFLEDHEDVKSQFLGFCLKRHHRKKQSEKEQAAAAAAAALKTAPHLQSPMGYGQAFNPRVNFSNPPPRNILRHSTPRHSMSSLGGGYTPSGRHEPYPVTRPQKRNSLDSYEQGAGAVNQVKPAVSSPVVKMEPTGDNESGVNSSMVPSSSHASDSGSNQDGSVSQKPGISAPNDNEDSTQDSNVSSDATLPNTPSNPNNDTGNSEMDYDPNVSVKIESSYNENEELEITGVEPGRHLNSPPQENWVPDQQSGIMFDTSGAMGNQGDMPGGSQDYSRSAANEDILYEINPDFKYGGGESDSNISDFNLAEASLGDPGKTRFRLADMDELAPFMGQGDSYNKHTQRKTKADMDLFGSFMCCKKELRNIEDIPPRELNEYITDFLLSVTKKDGGEYEPCTLRGFISSIDRFLKTHGYKDSIISSPLFRKARAALKGKQRQLKALGKGNKPKAAAPLNDDIIEQFYECGTIGDRTPLALIHSMWMICTLRLRIKTGVIANHLRWGNVQLREDEQGEHLVYDTGEGVRSPRVYGGGEEKRDPVRLYKLYASKRPEEMLDLDSPFFLAVANKYPISAHHAWYRAQPMGINKIHNIMNTMKSDAGIEDKRLTSFSVRKHLTKKLLEQHSHVAITQE